MAEKINLIYFSPTGNTKRTVEAMAEAAGGEPGEMDLTVLGEARRWGGILMGKYR